VRATSSSEAWTLKRRRCTWVRVAVSVLVTVAVFAAELAPQSPLLPDVMVVCADDVPWPCRHSRTRRHVSEHEQCRGISTTAAVHSVDVGSGG
jgi:hypothetical protein